MSDAALNIELDDHRDQGIWPWVIGALALAALLFSVNSDIRKITQSLFVQAHAITSASNAGNIEVDMDGRDVTLLGAINAEANRDAVTAQISAIDGVRIVRDQMSEFDPKEQAQLELLDFRSRLLAIDTSNVAFEAGRASLTAGSELALLELVQLLRAYPDYRVRVAGHTDNTGRPEVNLRISRDRAAAVASFLADQRIDPARIIAQGYGATRPIADNASESGRAANRRIEINYVD